MNIDVAKIRQILDKGPGVSCGQFDEGGPDAVVVVFLHPRHVDAACTFTQGIIDKEVTP